MLDKNMRRSSHIKTEGEVTEWPNVRDWKSRVGQKPTEGSNPSLSASFKTEKADIAQLANQPFLMPLNPCLQILDY